MGPKHSQALIFHERAAIKTMVLEKGHVEARSELWGENRVSLNFPMDAPSITWSHEVHSPSSYCENKLALTKPRSGSIFLNRNLVTANGHMKEGD